MRFRITRRRLEVRSALAALLITIAAVGCGIKTKVKVPVSAKIAAAKTATTADLLSMLREQGRQIKALYANPVTVTLTTGKPESGNLDVYHSAPGYLLVRRPDSIKLTIQEPIAKTSILELVSVGDEFELWNKRDNKCYVGKNSAREFEVEAGGQMPSFTARPIHIFQAILPPPIALDQPGLHFSITQEQDNVAKYYVLAFFEEGGGAQLHAVRRFWIERSEMAVTRDEAFNPNGEACSVVHYSDFVGDGDARLARLILIERPLDGYKLELKVGKWSENPDLPDSAFILNHPGAERVVLKEKSRSDSQ